MRAKVWAVLLASLLAACGDASTSGGAAPGPTVTGSLGAFDTSDAAAVVSGLCELRDPEISRDDANTTFFEQVHSRLHVLAAAIEPIDRPASGTLFEAKEKVELDLQGPQLPASFGDDVSSLLEAVTKALDVAGLPSGRCG
jgi:hypothetical protein